jgi:8-oxo-dGTP pyrophosphatase MutT (NUDIX family)
MVASAFLPVALVNGQLLFLFGREAYNDSSPGFSDFGGGVEKSENIYEAGLREFAEETTGFFGNAKDLKKLVKSNGGIYKMQHNEYHIHIFRMAYDPNLPTYYNNNHKFVYDKLDHTFLQRTRIFEKIEIQWMTAKEMKRRRREFRQFYQEIVDKIIAEEPKIKAFYK